jgi:hypothetical protein
MTALPWTPFVLLKSMKIVSMSLSVKNVESVNSMHTVGHTIEIDKDPGWARKDS